MQQFIIFDNPKTSALHQEEFQNPQISLHSLPDYRQLNLQPLNRKYLGIIIINYLILTIIFGTLITFGLLAASQVADLSSLYPLIGILAIPFVLSFISAILRYLRRGYALRAEDWVYAAGIFATTTTIIPYKKVQYVALKEGWLSRAFDLATIELYTAGTGGSDLTVHGIPKEDALRIRDFLTEKIKSGAAQSSAYIPTHISTTEEE
ncbi:MAG: PH domain-containing protein [Weeksellaceae bacterium]|nr:PH domain-containing protein [Weeksellaceae bacterium]